MPRLVTSGCLLTAALLLGGCAGRLFYFPTHATYRTPDALGLAVEEVRFRSLDGTALHGWFLPATGPARGTVVHFHGNAQNISSHFLFVDWLPAAGYNVFTFDYRGYGQSEGKPDRCGLLQDSVAALRYVRTRPDVDPQRLVVLAQSLGVGNAVTALAQEDRAGVRAVILDSGFASYRAIVRDKIALLPGLRWVRWPLSWVVVGNGGSAAGPLHKLSPIPVLLLHGTADRVVPFAHAEALYRAAREPKQLWILEGADHTEAFTTRRAEYAPRVAAYLREVMPP